MTSAAHLAFFGAAGIAMMSALFGVGMARLLWADDLKFAQGIEAGRKEIDATRDQMEASLQETIKSQEDTIAILRRGMKHE